MRAVAISALLALSITATQASAEWENTRWGMSPAQVQAATGDPLQPIPDHVQRSVSLDGSTAKLAGAFAAGAFHFRSSFQFDPAMRLNAIKLDLVDDSQCEALTSTLQSRYGPPGQRDRSPYGYSFTWTDQQRLNVVTLAAHPTLNRCAIIYRPLDGAAINKL